MAAPLDDAAALRLAHDVLEAAVGHLTEGNADRESPCAGWSARDVAQHVVGGAVRYRMLLDGASADELDPTRTADHLGQDAWAAAREADEVLAEAFAKPGSLTAVVHHPAGDVPGRRLLVMRVFEAAIHGWDIARAVGADEGLDGSLCAWMLARVDDIEGLRAAGYYGDRAHADGDAQDRLLAAVGRSARQRP